MARSEEGESPCTKIKCVARKKQTAAKFGNIVIAILQTSILLREVFFANGTREIVKNVGVNTLKMSGGCYSYQ